MYVIVAPVSWYVLYRQILADTYPCKLTAVHDRSPVAPPLLEVCENPKGVIAGGLGSDILGCFFRNRYNVLID